MLSTSNRLLAAAQAPKQRFVLALLPTPIHAWDPGSVPGGVKLWIKRDDLSGMQLSGNKVLYVDFL
jgi:1-aminocyclopropane-1-carboxylate deaminase/D-cysteine desulfhydrase-like pyridoxal-dependent ACC family enzyme